MSIYGYMYAVVSVIMSGMLRRSAKHNIIKLS